MLWLLVYDCQASVIRYLSENSGFWNWYYMAGTSVLTFRYFHGCVFSRPLIKEGIIAINVIIPRIDKRGWSLSGIMELHRHCKLRTAHYRGNLAYTALPVVISSKENGMLRTPAVLPRVDTIHWLLHVFSAGTEPIMELTLAGANKASPIPNKIKLTNTVLYEDLCWA